MCSIRYQALPTDRVRALQRGGRDAYGERPEAAVSDGEGNPCRHCLQEIPEGAPMLILAYRPFARLQPYAETGPIFLCGTECGAGSDAGMPPVLRTSPDYLLKGYSADERIRAGTGRIVPQAEVEAYAESLLARPEIAFVDVRSARNNCFLLRILRGGDGVSG